MAQALQLEAEIVVFGRDLTPRSNASYQYRDRAQGHRSNPVDLDIFAQHATTREGKLQVELAHQAIFFPGCTESIPLYPDWLVELGKRLPGETKLEIDRRRVKDRIYSRRRSRSSPGKGDAAKAAKEEVRSDRRN